jgi:hypothetical protein
LSPRSLRALAADAGRASVSVGGFDITQNLTYMLIYKRLCDVNEINAGLYPFKLLAMTALTA